VSFGDFQSLEGFETVTQLEESGYWIQAEIPLNFVQLLGFSVQINDSNERAEIRNMEGWHASEGILKLELSED